MSAPKKDCYEDPPGEWQAVSEGPATRGPAGSSSDTRELPVPWASLAWSQAVLSGRALTLGPLPVPVRARSRTGKWKLWAAARHVCGEPGAALPPALLPVMETSWRGLFGYRKAAGLPADLSSSHGEALQVHLCFLKETPLLVCCVPGPGSCCGSQQVSQWPVSVTGSRGGFLGSFESGVLARLWRQPWK